MNAFSFITNKTNPSKFENTFIQTEIATLLQLLSFKSGGLGITMAGFVTVTRTYLINVGFVFVYHYNRQLRFKVYDT